MIGERAPRGHAKSRGYLGRRRGAWAATLLATAASWYVLESWAISVGAALAASGALAGLDRPLLLAFLVASYVAWGLGLRRNLAANWSLLNRTGASTNVASKAAHDIARATAAGPRACRFAASAGYLLAEAAKEVPYYAGASGVALLSDSVSTGDAIVFLGGTNVGAALYEYGLAWATRTYLRYAAVEEKEPPERSTRSDVKGRAGTRRSTGRAPGRDTARR